VESTFGFNTAIQKRIIRSNCSLYEDVLKEKNGFLYKVCLRLDLPNLSDISKGYGLRRIERAQGPVHGSDFSEGY
jgi:hypothetical protein